jgi:organic hydroperoxide reductase OsmC/OhrA
LTARQGERRWTRPQAELAALAEEAHEQICPYSHATRNNVDVQLTVIGR